MLFIRKIINNLVIFIIYLFILNRMQNFQSVELTHGPWLHLQA